MPRMARPLRAPLCPFIDRASLGRLRSSESGEHEGCAALRRTVRALGGFPSNTKACILRLAQPSRLRARVCASETSQGCRGGQELPAVQPDGAHCLHTRE